MVQRCAHVQLRVVRARARLEIGQFLIGLCSSVHKPLSRGTYFIHVSVGKQVVSGCIVSLSGLL